MKFFVLNISLIFLVNLTSAQNNRKIFTSDDLAQVVVNLRQKKTDTTYINGTGIFIAHDNDLFILTATHIAKEIKINCEIIISGENDTPTSLMLNQLIKTEKPNWQNHEIADLSLLKLYPPKDISIKYLKNRFLPLFYFESRKVPPSRNIELTTIGFPLGLGSSEYFSPLTFRSHASSGFISLNRADTKTPCTFIILENPSVSGYSGGPVFDLQIYQESGMKLTGEGTVCIGIIHGTIKDKTGGKLAAITPSFYVFDFFKN